MVGIKIAGHHTTCQWYYSLSQLIINKTDEPATILIGHVVEKL